MAINRNVSLDDHPVQFGMAVVGAHAHVASATLATAQTYTKPDGATAVLMQNTGTQGIRFTLDGTTPESALGFQLRAYSDPVLVPCPGASVKAIREADGAALDYQWVK